MSTSPLFRQIALDKISSPDQLDQTMRVTGPMYWTSMLAILIALVAAGIWSFTGSIPTKSIGEGTVIRPGGVFSLAAGGSGFVKSFDVKVGDHVTSGEVVAEIHQPSSDDDIQALEARLSELREQTREVVSTRVDAARMQAKTFDLQRANDKSDIREQEALAKVAEEELATSQQLYDKGLITRQPVLDAKQRLVSIQSAIGRLHTDVSQADSQAFQSSSQPAEIRKQQELQIHDLESRLTALRNRSHLTSTVITPVSGEVIEEKIYTGAMVTVGAPVITIQPDNDQVIAAVYVPSSLAKDIKPGMDAEISPSTAKREEFGFIRGKVAYVAHFPATSAGMMNRFENDALVASLQSRGLVTEVDVTMERSSDTPSGFRWSSSRGPETAITSGTLCQTQIITRSQKPIELVFPFLKKITGLR